MKPGIPWSVKGIEPEVREAAKYAARRSGLSLGEWLNHLILEQADTDEEEEDFEPRPRPRSGQRGERLGRLSERLERLDSGDTAHARIYGRSQRGPDPRIISDVLERLEASERRTESAFETITERLEELANQVTTPRHAAEAREDDASVKAVESAIRNIVSHMEVNEKRTRDQLNDLQARMNRLREDAGSDPAIGRIEQRLSEMTRRLERIESGEQAHELLEVMESHIARVNERIDAMKGPGIGEMSRNRAELAGLKNRLERLEEAAVEPEALSTIRADFHALSHELREDIRALAARADAASGFAAPPDAGLVAQMHELTERVAQSESRLEHVAVLEHSIREILSRLEAQAAEDDEPMLAQGPSPELTALETALASLAERTAQADDAQKESLAALQATLEGIADKIATLEAEAQAAAAAYHQQQQQAPAAEPLPAPDFIAESLPAEPAPTPEAAWQNLLKAHVTNPPFSAPPEPAQLAPAAAIPPASFDEPLRAMRLDEVPGAVAAPPPAARTEDYVAAARRAALAAQASQADSSSHKKKGLGVIGKPGKAASAGETSAPKAKRTRLLRLALIIILAASAVIAGPKLAPKMISAVMPVPAKVEKAPGQQTVPAPAQKAEPEAAKDKSSSLGLPAATAAEGDLATASFSPAADPALAAQPSAMPQFAASFGPPALKAAALSGDVTAQFVVATKMLEGNPSPETMQQAARWLSLAAAKGLAPAQYRLATLYELGKGVPRNSLAARKLYERAATQGHVKAMHNLAVMLSGGDGSKPDYPHAIAWFEKAAQHGLPDSQFNLAVFYDRGAGVEADPAKAAFWYGVLAAKGDTDAEARAKVLNGKLTSSERAQVKADVEAYRPQAADAAVNQVAAKPEWQPGAGATAGAEINSQHIKEAQRLLSLLGYPAGKADGVLNDKTVNALRVFQLQNGLPVNGVLDQRMLAALREKQPG